jgi:hypothetical protein
MAPDLAGTFLRKIPKVNWFYTLGSAFVAVNQIVTVFATIYYVPTPDHATIVCITTRSGRSLIYGLHHWGSAWSSW